MAFEGKQNTGKRCIYYVGKIMVMMIILGVARLGTNDEGRLGGKFRGIGKATKNHPHPFFLILVIRAIHTQTTQLESSKVLLVNFLLLIVKSFLFFFKADMEENVWRAKRGLPFKNQT